MYGALDAISLTLAAQTEKFLPVGKGNNHIIIISNIFTPIEQSNLSRLLVESYKLALIIATNTAIHAKTIKPCSKQHKRGYYDKSTLYSMFNLIFKPKII